MKFRNPTNGYEETAYAPALWCLLFGTLYFAAKGIWGHAFISLVLACCTGGLSWLIYPFAARGIVEGHYLRRGWQKIG
jgi:hypothetical protein